MKHTLNAEKTPAVQVSLACSTVTSRCRVDGFEEGLTGFKFDGTLRLGTRQTGMWR